MHPAVAFVVVMLTDQVGRSGGVPGDVDDRCGQLDGQAFMELMSVLAVDADINSWRRRAACQAASAELFFPIGRTGDAIEHIDAAKSVCQTCPVQAACLRFALETNQEAGIWGGTSEEERKALRQAWLAERRRLTA